jgi:glycosyltransferase involved in cell wall biosynthesis
MSGQGNFLARLAVALAEMKLPPYQILAPVRGISADTKKVIIGRFDGTFIYRMTPANAYNFVRANKLKKLPRLRAVEESKIRSVEILDRLAAYYLNRYDRYVKSYANACLYQSSLSRKEHEFVHGADRDGKLTRVIPNGVPCDRFSPGAPGRRGRKNGRLELAITAKFRIGKRLRDAIIVLNILRKHHRAVCLNVIGDLDVLVKESIEGLDLSGCVFHGHLSSDSLPDIYSSMDFGISPSLFDSCPNSVIEMLACGVPVLTTSASGAAELVPDHRFILSEDVPLSFMEFHNYRNVPKVNHREWAERLLFLVDYQRSLSEIAAFHARKNFDISVVAAGYANLITDAWDEK